MQTLAVCEDFDARITVGDEDEYYTGDDISKDMTYYIDDTLAIGRIELCFNGSWRAVCDNVWSREDASVACYQLGFSRAGDLIFNSCRVVII